MQSPKAHTLSVRYTTLSDRFRSLWTFYQFLGGVLKHLDEGPIPYSYDFQALHEQLKEIVHKIGVESTVDATPELDSSNESSTESTASSAVSKASSRRR